MFFLTKHRRFLFFWKIKNPAAFALTFLYGYHFPLIFRRKING
jgi:hypothetical protein